MLSSQSAVSEEIERGQESVPLTLFQLVARADLVVHGKVKDGAHRYAIIDIEEVLRGEPQGSQLRIDFRDLNLSLHGQEMVVFREGEDYVLFLMKKHWRKPSQKNVDIFDLLRGRRGRLLLPPEGAGVDLEAVRRLVSIARSAPEVQIEGLRAGIGSDNPRFRDAAMDDLIRVRQVEEPDLPGLLRLLNDPAPAARSRSLQLIGILLSRQADSDNPDFIRGAVEMVLGRGRMDPEVEVRVQAVRALGAWPEVGVLSADLKAIASQDASQLVRYEAERILFKTGPPVRSPS